MIGRTFILVMSVAVMAFVVSGQTVTTVQAEESLPSKSDQSCLKCHDYDKKSNIMAGKFLDVSSKAQCIQLQIDKDKEVIFFDDSTVLKNAPSYKEIPKQESVRVSYHKRDGKLFAKEIEVKKGLEVAKEQLITVEEVAELVAKGPEEGNYVLLDSRPAEMFDQGHIPTALSMPFFAFDKLQDKLLPKDKDVMQIYYCGGFS